MNMDMQPLNSSNIDEVYFSPRVLSARNIIENIIRDGLTGIYLIGGDRGAGKTTIINFAMEKYNFKKRNYLRDSNVNYISRINVMNEEMELIRELLSFLEDAFEENVKLFETEEPDSFKKGNVVKLRYKQTTSATEADVTEEDLQHVVYYLVDVEVKYNVSNERNVKLKDRR